MLRLAPEIEVSIPTVSLSLDAQSAVYKLSRKTLAGGARRKQTGSCKILERRNEYAIRRFRPRCPSTRFALKHRVRRAFFQTGVTYVCDGERMEIESCNLQNLSDLAICMVAYPDCPPHDGFMAYTDETR
jgi:hypothetical protein